MPAFVVPQHRRKLCHVKLQMHLASSRPAGRVLHVVDAERMGRGRILPPYAEEIHTRAILQPLDTAGKRLNVSCVALAQVLVVDVGNTGSIWILGRVMFERLARFAPDE